MATLDDRFAFSGEADPLAGVVFAPVPVVRRREMMTLLMTGNAHSSRTAVDQFFGSTASQSLDLQDFWGAFRADAEGEAIASLLLVRSPGRTAIVFVSPLLDDADKQPIVSTLIHRALAVQDTDDVHLAQALLEPSQSREAEALTSAGFHKLAHLVYMQRPTERNRVDLTNEPTLQAHRWTGDNRALFVDAILASYQQTADCPGLIGMREMDDIIDGHQATGEFDPDHWMVLTANGESVGVLLLNRVLNRQGMEIVYLGLAPAARGKGLGRRLVQHAINTAHAQGVKQIVLAVDELNQPAMTLYRKLGFTPTARKLAMIRSLRK